LVAGTEDRAFLVWVGQRAFEAMSRSCRRLDANSTKEMKKFFSGIPGHKKTGTGRSTKAPFTRQNNLSAVRPEKNNRSARKILHFYEISQHSY
jgi:hypothetical protein